MTELVTITAAPTKPRSGGARSLATTERIVAAAEALLCRHGARFTLGDVAAAARVSMASIYSRFPAKEHLVREVQSRVLDAMTAQIAQGLDRIAGEGGDLEWLTMRIVDVYAEAHLARALIIRSFHEAARDDKMLRDKGKAVVEALLDLARQALLRATPRLIPAAAQDRLVVIMQIFLHALASYLGFGYTAPGDTHGDWLAFKETTARMVHLTAREVLEG